MGDQEYDDDGLVKDLYDIWSIDYNDLEFGEKLGEGAFGYVFSGSYFGTEVAIKRLFEDDESPDAELFIQREINVLQGIRHPNVVQFIGLARHPELGIHIVTELVKAGDLRKLLKDPKNKLSWLDRVKIAHSTACAMAYLHSKNIIHRDLKSKNLLVEDGLKIKICDFGFARTTSGKSARPMTLCGTDDWMAPEIILGFPYSQAADVFSFGIVLCEIITRRKVSVDLQRSPMDAFGLNVDQFKKIIPSDCPLEFSILAIECCAHDPEERPQFNIIVRKLSALMKELYEKEKEEKNKSGNQPQSVARFQAFANRLNEAKNARDVKGTTATTTTTPAVTIGTTKTGTTGATATTATTTGAKTATTGTTGATATKTGTTGTTATTGAKTATTGTTATTATTATASANNNRDKRVASNKWPKIEEAPKTNTTTAISNNVTSPTATKKTTTTTTTTTTSAPSASSSTSTSSANGPFYSLQLLKDNPPPGIDKNDLPRYLSEEDFFQLFKMAKTDFYKMPAWKQRGRKREAGLF